MVVKTVDSKGKMMVYLMAVLMVDLMVALKGNLKVALMVD
jgi:hypothetical protein